ncbi:MAG: ATP-dependent DNA helicase [Candidatus Korarchaeota archaeon]
MSKSATAHLKFFPYTPRGDQEESIKFIQECVRKGKNICFHASTGFGKTPVILAALLPFAKRQGYKILWAVRTGNEADRPIEELKVINSRTKNNFFGFSFRGKKDMCLLASDLKLEGMEHEDVSYICKKKVENGECEYYDNMERFDLEIEGPLLYSEIFEMCKRKRVCPYMLQKDILPYATVIGLNYNYIISEDMSWAIRRDVPFEDCFLVVDEAHNLQHACEKLNSDQITLGTCSFAIREIEKFDTWRGSEVKKFLTLMKSTIEDSHRDDEEEKKFSVATFLRKMGKEIGLGMDEIENMFSSIRKYGTKIRESQYEEGKQPRSSLYHLGNFWLNAMSKMREEGIAFLSRKEGNNIIIEMRDMRASEILKHKWADFHCCVFCSGTLNPIDGFAETIGLSNYVGRTSRITYNSSNILALILKGLSTRGESLPPEMASKYVEVIKVFVKGINENVAVFSASYRIQDELMAAGLREVIEASGKLFFQERQGMSGSEAREVLDEFKALANGTIKGCLCGIAAGRFAEGADFPGRQLEGIFLVGIPFEKMTIRTQLYIEYYEKIYGEEKGYYYSYIVPALRRASQVLGRALRSKDDRAVLVCGDERYKEAVFFNLLPDFFRENALCIEPSQLSNEISKWLVSNDAGKT